jgi:SAM-dependent methyltransferase
MRLARPTVLATLALALLAAPLAAGAQPAGKVPHIGMLCAVTSVERLTARLDAGIRVADIGCGTGFCVNLMAERFPRSQFVGYDFSDHALEQAGPRHGRWAWGTFPLSRRTWPSSRPSRSST